MPVAIQAPAAAPQTDGGPMMPGPSQGGDDPAGMALKHAMAYDDYAQGRRRDRNAPAYHYHATDSAEERNKDRAYYIKVLSPGSSEPVTAASLVYCRAIGLDLTDGRGRRVASVIAHFNGEDADELARDLNAVKEKHQKEGEVLTYTLKAIHAGVDPNMPSGGGAMQGKTSAMLEMVQKGLSSGAQEMEDHPSPQGGEILRHMPPRSFRQRFQAWSGAEKTAVFFNGPDGLEHYSTAEMDFKNLLSSQVTAPPTSPHPPQG